MCMLILCVSDFVFLISLTSTVFIVAEFRKFLDRLASQRVTKEQHIYLNGNTETEKTWSIV